MESEKLSVTERSEFQPQLGTGYCGARAKAFLLWAAVSHHEMVGAGLVYSADVIRETHFSNTLAG